MWPVTWRLPKTEATRSWLTAVRPSSLLVDGTWTKLKSNFKWCVFISRFSGLDDHSKRFMVQFYIHPFTHTFIQCVYVQQFRVQYFAQGIGTREDWDWTANLLVRGNDAPSPGRYCPNSDFKWRHRHKKAVFGYILDFGFMSGRWEDVGDGMVEKVLSLNPSLAVVLLCLICIFFIVYVFNLPNIILIYILAKQKIDIEDVSKMFTDKHVCFLPKHPVLQYNVRL